MNLLFKIAIGTVVMLLYSVLIVYLWRKLVKQTEEDDK